MFKLLLAEVIVRNSRENNLPASGNKGDKVDGNKLAKLWRGVRLKGVYYGGAMAFEPSFQEQPKPAII
jgi:hypothetical protein